MTDEQVQEGTVLTYEDAQELKPGDRLCFTSPLAPFGVVDDVVRSADPCISGEGQWVFIRLRHSHMTLLIQQRETLMVVTCVDISGRVSLLDLVCRQPFHISDFDEWLLPDHVREQCAEVPFQILLRHRAQVGPQGEAVWRDWVHCGADSPEEGGTDYRLYMHQRPGDAQSVVAVLGRIMPADSEVRVIKKEKEETA